MAKLNNGKVYSSRLGDWVDPNSSNLFDIIYTDADVHYRSGNPDLKNTLRNKGLGIKAKAKGAQVPAVYDPFSANRTMGSDEYFDSRLGGGSGSYAIDAAQMANDIRTPGNKISNFYNSKIAPNFGWSKGSGIKAFGKNIGKWGNIAGGALQGVEALGNLQDLNESQSTTDDLIGEILNNANANPLVSSYLTPSQLSLLRQVKRGDKSPETDFDDFIPDDMSDFGDILKDAGLGLAVGGIPGALIGGIGGAVNSGLSGATEDQAQQNAELEMLLQALEDANMQYQSMKRPNLPGLGLQSRYYDMYY